MTVVELIGMLERMPPNAKIVLAGDIKREYEIKVIGVNKAGEVTLEKLKSKCNST